MGLDTEVDHLPAHRTVSLDGAVVVPGFHDAHCHTTSYGVSLSLLDLSTAADSAAVLDAVADWAAALPADAWVIGMGWQGSARSGEPPSLAALDRAAGGRGVWLTHVSGHSCLVNTPVLAAIGVTAQTPVPIGGRIEYDAEGRPTGVLEDMAMDLVKDHIGPASMERLIEAIGRATSQYVREGITSFTEAGVGCPGIDHSPVEIGAYQGARERGLLHARATLMVYSELLHHVPGHRDDTSTFGLDLGVRSGLGDPWLRVGAMKIWIDGSGVGGSAATTSDEGTDIRGLQGAPEVLRKVIADAHRSGWQVAAHAMGDGALDLLLEALESVDDVPACRRRRHRVEHCGVVRPDQVARMANLGLVAVPQAVFVRAFGDALSEVLGPERTDWSLPVRTILTAGMVVAGSSDRPVAPGAPLVGMQSMVERLTETGAVYGPDERVSAESALHAYTRGAAYASHLEDSLGQLSPGLQADLVVLDADPTSVATAKIETIEVLATMVDGEPVHDPAGLLGQGETRQ